MSLVGMRGLALVFVAYLFFLAGAKSFSPATIHPADVPGSVVLPAPMQTVLYLGDRYLAANVEATRVLMTGGPVEGIAQDYFERLHLVISALNACHEDNYYVANALLGFAGSVDASLGILRSAARCRYWDEVPPFFLGFNLYYFKRENILAKNAMFEAARRATGNRAGFQKMGILFEAETHPDVRVAQRFLIYQRDQSRDQKLRQLLQQRIDRLGGLVILRDAQLDFERRFGRPLKDPNELITNGLLKQFPSDPVHLGYLFQDGQFVMREVKVFGLEGARK